MAPGKRKRNERGSVDSGDSRPSPHRPGNTTLGQHDREADMRGNVSGRRPTRGGRGGGRAPRNERRDSLDTLGRAALSSQGASGPMSPPAPRPTGATQGQIQPPKTTRSPAPTEEAPPLENIENPLPYDYSHITDNRVSMWSFSGRQEVISAGIQALDDLDILDLSSIFQELVRAALDRRIDPSDAGDCIREILAAPTDELTDKVDGPSLFLDSLSIMADTESFDPVVHKILSASGISPSLIRKVVDAPLLQDLGLTRNTFIKVGIRQVTNLLYRQANHNLLREETEGYSKLVTELFTTSGSEPPTSDVVEDTFERVKGLIGTFDLDVGRVLDVTLDVFAAVLIKQFRFFIKFLRISSWWPREPEFPDSAKTDYWGAGLPKWALPGSTGWSTMVDDDEAGIEQRDERDRAFWDRAREIGMDAFFELGGRQAINAETKKSDFLGEAQDDTHTNGDLQWIEATGTLPPCGNRVAAQLLGFKLRFYASEARDQDDVLPANLIYLTALLIKIGFISLRDLYPHLWPFDEDMPAVRVAKMNEIAEKERLNRPGGGANNALTMAGALPDDSLPNNGRNRDTAAAKPDLASVISAGADDKEKETLPEPLDQKVVLLVHLLTIGAIPESLFMLGRFPWIPEAFPEIYDLLHRILHHSINKVYELSQVTGIPAVECPGKKIADFDQGSALKGQIRRTEGASRKPLRWPFPDKYDTNEGMVYRFYWDEWADNVPVCQTVDDIFTLCGTFLNLSGVNIGRDAALLSKLATIGTKNLALDHSEANLARWEDLLKRLIVPALSLTRSNTSVVNEVYDMLRYYPCSVRFSIYAEWFEGATSRLPAMVAAFSRARLETLSTMKRISMTNLTLMARSLAKTAYSNPGVVFKVALDQIEAYSNLTDVVVECAKYFTDLGYDVLIWSLMSSLGGKARSRIRDDSALLRSRWLIALSKFSGRIFKRYSIMNPAPILQYVSDQLYKGNSTDLIILEELISQMSGVVSDTDFTDSQLVAMTGGEFLRRQTLINLQDRRFESTKTAKRLMRSLTDTKLAGQILISIAQHRQAAIYAVPEEDAHIKYLATMIDEAQRLLVQYLDLLRSNLSVDQFDGLVPNTAELMADYGLEPPLAFLIGRASYARRILFSQMASIRDITKDQSISNGTGPQTDGEGDLRMKLDESIATVAVEGVGPDSPADAQMVGLPDGSVIAASPPSSADAWREALAPLADAVQTVIPQDTWRLLTPEFYVVFWQLSLADISMPMESYTIETTRLSKDISDLMRDRTDMSRTGVARREETRKALESTRDELLKESKQEMIKYERIRSRLNKEKLQWFSNVRGRYDNLVDTLLEECFLPRVLLSPSDADYCFKFIKLLHANGTPSFRTLGLYGHLFRSNRLRSIIFACTIREAENLGRFLKHILADLSRWHANKAAYEKEALGPNRDLPGFATKMGKDEKPASVLEYEDFRRIVFNFHKNLNTALKACLNGLEWMHIRNAITVLKAVIEYFPALDFMGKSYQAVLLDIGAREKKTREDLSLTANALMPELKKRQWKWVMPQAFATNLGEVLQHQNGVKSKAPQPNQSEPAATKSILKPTALEFKPSLRVTPNGESTLKPTASNEVEDGEVDDARAQLIATVGDSTTSQATLELTTSTTLQASASNTTPNSSLAPPTESEDQGNISKVPVIIPSQSAQPVRPDFGKNSLTTSVTERPHTGLPSRPDVPFPSHLPSDRHMSSRHGDRRDNHHTRLDRPGDGLRDRTRDSGSFERRPLDSLPRDMNRAMDRDGDRDRHDSKRRGVDIRENWEIRGHRDRSLIDTARLPDTSGRLSRNDDMPPPRSTTSESGQGPITNPDPPINPARAAQIFGGQEQIRSEPVRPGRDDHRERPSSRPQSPRRDRFAGLDRDHPDSRRNDRAPAGRPPPNYTQEFPRVRHDDAHLNSGGMRGDYRGTERGPSERLRDASAFQPNPSPVRTVDPEHGRLNQSSRPPPDPNFGRLNAGTPAQIPSGPSRDRNNRSVPGGSRTTNTIQQRFDVRGAPQEPARPPTPEKQPPTGPAAGRAPRRSGSGMFDPPASAPVSAPSTPAVTSPTAAVHPDRLRIIDPAVAQQAPNAAAHSTQQPYPPPHNMPTGVHPSRLQAFQNDHPLQRQAPLTTQMANVNSSAPVPASPISAGPPSGPKVLPASNINNGLASNGLPPPTGPASANERTRGPMRQLAGINNTLQQAGQRAGPDRLSERGTTIRGRGGRPSLGGPGGDLPSPGPPTPTNMIPDQERPGNRNGDRGRDSINSDHSLDLFPTRAVNGNENERDRDRDRADSRSGASTRGREAVPPLSRRESGRSGRHSRRNSRSRSPGREGMRDRERERGRERGPGPGLGPGPGPGLVEDPARGEYRDHGRSVDGGGGRDRRQNDRDVSRRDSSDKGRDGREAMPARAGMETEWGGGMGGPLDRGGGGSNRRDLRSSGDARRDGRNDGGGPMGRGDGGAGGSGRKRRGDEGGMGMGMGMGSDMRGHDKRPRR